MSSKSKKKPAEPAAKRVTDAALDEIEAARSALYDKITAAIDGVDTRDDRRVRRLKVLQTHTGEVFVRNLEDIRALAPK